MPILPKVDSGVAIQVGVEKLDTHAFLAALVASSDNPIIGKTLDGTVVSWNEAAERLYGYRASEMLGRDIGVLIPPDRPDELSNLLARVRSGEIVRNMQTQRIRKTEQRLMCR